MYIGRNRMNKKELQARKRTKNYYYNWSIYKWTRTNKRTIWKWNDNNCLNFSHGDFEEQGYRIAGAKNQRRIRKPISILLDTKGPEIRVENL